MAVNLTKGQKVDLTKSNPGLSKIVVGLGWDTNKYDGGSDFDLDAAAFLLNAEGKVASDADFVFYSNLKHSSGAVEHLGDNLTGEGDGDDEQIRASVASVVGTYRPAGEHGSEYKGTAYAEQMELVAKKESDTEQTV